jgi:hypothetical protein
MTWQPCVVKHTWQSRYEPKPRVDFLIISFVCCAKLRMVDMSNYSIQERLVVSEWMHKKAAQIRRWIKWWRCFSSDLTSRFRTEQLFLSYGNVKLTHVLIYHNGINSIKRGGGNVTSRSGRPIYREVMCAAFDGQWPPKPVWKRWAELKYRVQPRLSQEGHGYQVISASVCKLTQQYWRKTSWSCILLLEWFPIAISRGKFLFADE